LGAVHDAAYYTKLKRYVDVAAPGGELYQGDDVQIYSTILNHDYGYSVGTSMATPHATGLAGLLKAANSELRNYDVEWLIKLGAEDKGQPGWDEYFGYGRLNALEAVRLVRPPYQMTRGTPSLTRVQQNVQRSFPYPPGPGVNPGTYVCDVYKLEASTSHPYGDPLGWFSLTGYSLANPNPCREYLERIVNGSSITLRTYFYWLVRDVTGREVEKWGPVDPNLIPLQYTLVGCPSNWTELTSLPAPPSGKPIKDGGCMACDGGTDLIFASKGNKTGDFYSYNVGTGTWATKTGIPLGAEGKGPYKGSVICADGNGKLYLTKGNNTVGFWGYDAGTNAWTQLANVPTGGSGKKVKQGAGIAWATKNGHGYVYLLKGYRNEFHKYDPESNSWTQLEDAPIGLGNHIKWDAGSWLVSDGANKLYAHKAKYHEFYYFDTETEHWSTTALTPMPIPGDAGNKKAKDGSCAAWYSGDIYAFKGGNTTEFWRYSPPDDKWKKRDVIPWGASGQRKKVKAGAALAGYPGAGVYAFKGNKSYEFWRFVPTQSLGLHAAHRDTASGDSEAASGGPSLGGESPLMDGLEASKPRWNSQGTWVCYTTTDTLTGREQIYQCQYPMSSVEQRVVDMDEDCEEPVYSPDGQYIAFQLDDTVSDFCQLCVTTASDTGPVL
jgi:hypothetical protein